MQILILGMHRSGTSATARLINMMGAYFGPEGCGPEFTRANPKGFWERVEVFKLNESLLKSQGCAWHSLPRWPLAESAPPSITASIQRIIGNMDAFRPWFLKDPRLCLTLPCWLPLLEVPVAVIVYRDPVEIALSLHTRDRMAPEYAIALWEHYAVGMLNHTRHMPRLFVQHGEILKNPVNACEDIYTRLKLLGVRRLAMPHEREIRAFIDPALYRSRTNGGHPAHPLSGQQQALAAMLRGEYTPPDRLIVSEASRHIISTGLSQ